MGVMRVEKSAESDLRYSVIGSMRCECIELESRPSRARGLKRFGVFVRWQGLGRAPRGRVG